LDRDVGGLYKSPVAQDEKGDLEEAMRRYAGGDDSAFQALYTLVSPRLYGFCVRLTRRRSEADDVFQETFLKLHRSRTSYVPGSTAIHWVYAIARSVYLDRLRYQKRRPEVSAETEEGISTFDLMEGDSASPEANVQAVQLMSVIDRTIRGLPENQRAAYVLLKEEGLSVGEAARVLGTTAMAVKLRAHRAYEALRAALGAHEK
jgi:RNA polymerase sigma-70 factor (ECF subfamily)